MGKEKCVQLAGRAMTWEEFVEHVRQQLASHKGQIRPIAQGADLSYRWTIDFRRKVYANPSADLVLRLAAALGLNVRVQVVGPPLNAKRARAGAARAASLAA